MTDKVDVAKLTADIESGQGCSALKVLSELNLYQRTNTLNEVIAEHAKRKEQHQNTVLRRQGPRAF